jgi:hypothetical protein
MCSPLLEFRARPLEATVAVTQPAGCERWPLDIVFPVWRGQDHRARSRVAKEHACKHIKPRRLQMLDHLDEHRRIVAHEPWVAVEQRTLDERQAPALLRGYVIQVQAGCGTVETASRHVYPDDFDDFCDVLIVQEPADECAITAARVQDTSDTPIVQRGQHGLETLVLESDRGFQSVLGVATLRCRCVSIGVIVNRAARRGGPGGAVASRRVLAALGNVR